MFYLTTHSTHLILCYMIRKEGNVLFNDALNTLYIMLYDKEGNVLFNDALNTFYIMLHAKEGSVLFNNALNTLYMIRKEMFYLTKDSTHFILLYDKGPLG